jgi:hypothetical protein
MGVIVISTKIRGLTATWWLKFGSDSKPRTELKSLWSSGGSMQKKCDFLGNKELILHWKEGELGPWILWTTARGWPMSSRWTYSEA